MNRLGFHARARRTGLSSAAGSTYRTARAHLPARSAFTLIETMVVLVIAGIVMAISLPKFAAMHDRMSLRSAKQQFTAYLAVTRAAAIRQSQTSQLHILNSHMWSTVSQPNGTSTMVGRRIRLWEQFGVTVTEGGSAPDDSITFDSRGMSNTNAAAKYVLTRNGLKDSICVSRLGLITRTCGQ